MSSLSLYEVAIPTYTRGLNTFEHILHKAEAFAKDKGINVDTLASARLIEDQLPLAFQVQNATKSVVVYVGYLTGQTLDLWPNTETTFAELHARIQKARALLATVTPEVANAHADKAVTFPIAGKTLNLTVQQAILQQALPNFIFHLSTGYSILRAQGVPLGKADFIFSFLEV